MNIMLVSVTERTREIGIRLAIGAFERDVLTQFLIEAVVLVGVRRRHRHRAGARQRRSPRRGRWACRSRSTTASWRWRSLFSAAVGVVFGFFPARRAASLNPIDALAP